MPAAPLPPDESARLEALRSYDVLDSEFEAAFDDLTKMAATIARAPIAVISLVDERRQWFKSVVGLAARETPREAAFCAHAILRPDEALSVFDAQKDARFADNPLVTGDPRIRFYHGNPLVNPEKQALGTLCVIDRTPRMLTPDQNEALAALSRQVVHLMEKRRLALRVKKLEAELAALKETKPTP